MTHWLAAAALAACWPLLGAAAGCALTRQLRLPDVFTAPLVLAAGALVAYLIFWAYFISPALGGAMWLGLVVLNGAWVTRHLFRANGRLDTIPADVWAPFALTALVSAACLSYLAAPGVSPPKRFTLALPLADHLTPQLLADRFATGIRREGRPLAPLTTFALTTQTSDRPPLQAAISLATRPFGTVPPALGDIAYQTIGTVCQVAVLPSLLALATALGLSRREQRFVLTAVACSGFFLLNAVYPWPKLYTASLILTGLAIVVHGLRRSSLDLRHWGAVGALLALALLAHGSAIFSLLATPVALFDRSLRRALTWRAVSVAILAATLLLTPWLAYQHFIDPPGTRLVKIHLAGVLEGDDRGVLATIVDAYRATTLKDWLHGRAENLRGQGIREWHPEDPTAAAQYQQFFRLLSVLGTLNVGLLLLGRRPRPAVGVSIHGLVVYALAATALWILVMIRPGSAVVHHGSYTTTLLLFVGGAVGLATAGRLGSMLLWLNVAVFLAIWVTPRAGIPVLGWQPLPVAICVASTLSAAMLAWRWLGASHDAHDSVTFTQQPAVCLARTTGWGQPPALP
jgi:hypothetical protein